MNPTPLRLVVVCRVSTRCNLSCGFCAYDRRLGFARTTLADAAVERLIGLMDDWHQRQGGAPPLLSWLGGEPLLWPRWIDHSRLARDRGLAVSATTNSSTLWQPQTRAAVLEVLDELTISVDAIGAQHDRLRGWRGGYVRTLAAVRALADARSTGSGRLRLRANIVLMRSTVDQFAELCAALAQTGVDEISFNLLGGRDRPEFFAAEAVTPMALERFVRKLPQVRKTLLQSGVRLAGDASYLQRLDAASRQQAWPIADCAPGSHFLFVDEQGSVAPCAFTTADYGVPLTQISDLDELPSRFRARRAQACADACADCPSTQVFGKFAPSSIADGSSAQVVDLAHTDARIRDCA